MEEEMAVPEENGDVHLNGILPQHGPPPPAVAPAQEEAPAPPLNAPRLVQDPYLMAQNRARRILQSHEDGRQWNWIEVDDRKNKSTEERSRGCHVTRKITVVNQNSNNGVHNHLQLFLPPYVPAAPAPPLNDPELALSPIPVIQRVHNLLQSNEDNLKWNWTGTLERPISTTEHMFLCRELGCSVSRKLTVVNQYSNNGNHSHGIVIFPQNDQGGGGH